ncbi:ABC transporter ATP-binding protein [Lutibacter sp. B2]|nr:ABC transporter ATP-binding protein [Lutibacter sp. B2]
MVYKVEGLCFSYGKKKILEDLSFEIKKGKVTTIIGPNGSGKTTLLRTMTGQVDQYSGGIHFEKKALKEYSVKELSQKIAVVSQNVDIKFPFSCMEVVSMGRTPFRNRMKNLTKEDLDIVYKCMEITETLKFANTLITDVSGGERQRIMIAKALAQTPEVLILDESFSNIDIRYTIKILNLLRSMTKESNLTVISIMHDLNLTDLYSDDVLALQDGKLVQFGDASKVMKPNVIKSLFGINTKKFSEKGLVVLPTM